MANSPILIAGGGIAGLAAALGLARQGHASCILEQSPAFETVGAGIQIGPNAAKALQWLGAWEDLEASTVSPETIELRDGLTGKVLQRIGLGPEFERRFGAPYRVCHRADLLAALLAAVRRQSAIEVSVGARVTGYRNNSNSVDVGLETGTSRSGTHLIAADGIHSGVRALMNAAAKPVYRGQCLFRALVPLSGLSEVTQRNCVVLWMAPGFHVVHYPVSNGAELNLVVSVDSADAKDGWTEPAFGPELQHATDAACPELHDVVSLPTDWRTWAASECPPLATWHDRQVVLTGDAAHASLPYLAQGAAMALEDAVALAQSWDDFSSYEARRRSRTARVKFESRKMSAIYHASGPKRIIRNAVIQATRPRQFLNRLAWLYEFDPVRS